MKRIFFCFLISFLVLFLLFIILMLGGPEVAPYFEGLFSLIIGPFVFIGNRMNEIEVPPVALLSGALTIGLTLMVLRFVVHRHHPEKSWSLSLKMIGLLTALFSFVLLFHGASTHSWRLMKEENIESNMRWNTEQYLARNMYMMQNYIAGGVAVDQLQKMIKQAPEYRFEAEFDERHELKRLWVTHRYKSNKVSWLIRRKDGEAILERFE